MKNHFRIFLYLAVAVSLTGSALGQATVNESLETATIYVDAVNGSDSNPGTQDAPLASLNAGVNIAVANNKQGVGTRVVINPGVYRESLTLTQTAKLTSFPITLEAATPGTAAVSGAVQYTGWNSSATNPAIYTNSWPNNWGNCAQKHSAPPAQDIVLRREMVFVNGTAMTQVLAATDLGPGTFFADSNSNTLSVWPPSGTDMAAADVEVASLPTLLDVNGMDNLVFRGLVFQYAASCLDTSAVLVEGSAQNIIFDNDQFVWNNSLGFRILHPATYFTVQNSSAMHNGQSGLQGTQTKYGLWQNDVASYNNWRGAQGAYYSWNTSGAHFYEIHNDTIDGLTLAYNQTHGVHWDTDNTNITVSGLTSVNNLQIGAFVEANVGPFSFDKSYVCGNGVASMAATSALGGLQLRNSQNVSVTNSAIYSNNPNQLNVQGKKLGLWVQNWETGDRIKVVTSNVTFTNNVIYGVGAQFLFNDSYLVDPDWTTFAGSLISDQNTWWNPGATKVFKVAYPNAGTLDDFPAWQGVTGQDVSSAFTSTPDESQPCTVNADAPNFWLITGSTAANTSATGYATIAMSVSPLGGFADTVNLTADTGNALLTASFDNASIAGSGTTNLTVTTDPSLTDGTYPVVVIANSGDVTHTVTIPVTVSQSALTLSTTTLNFADTSIGNTSSAQSFNITNNSQNAITLTSLTASQDYTLSNLCGSTLGAGGTCRAYVYFNPTHVGTDNGTVIIVSSDAGSPHTITLNGKGIGLPGIDVRPGSLYVGEMPLGVQSASQNITVTNTSGNAAKLYIGNVTLTGVNPGDFLQTSGCPPALAAGAACTIQVAFKPTAYGTRNATLTVWDNSLRGMQAIGLTGHSQRPSGEAAVVSTSAVAAKPVSAASSGKAGVAPAPAAQANVKTSAQAPAKAHAKVARHRAHARRHSRRHHARRRRVHKRR